LQIPPSSLFYYILATRLDPHSAPFIVASHTLTSVSCCPLFRRPWMHQSPSLAPIAKFAITKCDRRSVPHSSARSKCQEVSALSLTSCTCVADNNGSLVITLNNRTSRLTRPMRHSPLPSVVPLCPAGCATRKAATKAELSVVQTVCAKACRAKHHRQTNESPVQLPL
jgi:hypothetical protein